MDLTRLQSFAAILLRKKLEAGTYVSQISVVDTAAKGKD
jgi:hypothetical protein